MPDPILVAARDALTCWDFGEPGDDIDVLMTGLQEALDKAGPSWPWKPADDSVVAGMRAVVRYRRGAGSYALDGVLTDLGTWDDRGLCWVDNSGAFIRHRDVICILPVSGELQ